MRIVSMVLASMVFAGTLSAPALATSPAKITAAKRALARANTQKGPEALIAARAKLESLAAAEPKSLSLHYWVAYADWRLVPRLSEDAKLGERYCKDGLAEVEKALKLEPSFADALALKAGLQGMSLQFDPSQTMSLGPEMMQHLARAVELAPKNPRVRFLDALNTLHAPAFVGGGPAPALAKFKEAIALFEASSTADSTAIDWGHEDAYLWAGRSAMKLDDYETARGFYQKTLELNPENVWVRHALMPEVEKAIAAKSEEKGKS